MKRHPSWSVMVGIALLLFSAAVAVGQNDPRDRLDRDPTDRNRVNNEEDSPARLREFEWQLDANRAAPRLTPPVTEPVSQWFLGVTVTYHDTGAECTRVVRRSPARQAGLEPGDQIVAVNGYQIGHVNGRLYRLERELELRADRLGRVRLLVQDHRTGNLQNVDVRLDDAERHRDPPERPEELLMGTVTAGRVTRLPPQAVLVVSLIDVTEPLSALTPIAQRSYRQSGPLPIPFELPFDANRIEPGRRYSLRAHVTVNGITALSTRDVYPVLTGRPQGRIQLELEPVR